jgi:guanidinopropionase
VSQDLTSAQLTEMGGRFQHWAGVATFLRCPYRPDMSDTDIGLIGFPYSGGNPIERMQYLGPRAVRNRSTAYRRIPRGFEIDPFVACRISDLGDMPLESVLNPDLSTAEAESFFKRVHQHGIIPITVGGDHSITTPILRAIAGPSSRQKGPIGMIHFDSHADTNPAGAGTKHHAGAAFRLGAEEGLLDPARTVQIGLHGPLAYPGQDSWSREHFTVITLDDLIDQGVDHVASEVRRVVGAGPTYLSFDLDVLDLAYAPGVADPEVNGMTTRELFALLNKLRGVNLVGADIACFCPPLDNPAQVTALTASQILLYFVAHIAEHRAQAKSSGE